MLKNKPMYMMSNMSTISSVYDMKTQSTVSIMSATMSTTMSASTTTWSTTTPLILHLLVLHLHLLIPCLLLLCILIPLLYVHKYLEVQFKCHLFCLFVRVLNILFFTSNITPITQFDTNSTNIFYLFSLIDPFEARLRCR